MRMALPVSNVGDAVNATVTGDYLKENGVHIHVKDGHTTPEKAKTFFNPRMKTCRWVSHENTFDITTTTKQSTRV